MSSEQITRREAGTIISAYTGVLLTDMDKLQTYCEKVLERPVWTHQLANKEVWNELRDKSKPDFMRVVEFFNSDEPLK